MKPMPRWFGYIMIGIGILVIITLRVNHLVAHPDWTEMQFLSYRWFWCIVAAANLCVGVADVLSRERQL